MSEPQQASEDPIGADTAAKVPPYSTTTPFHLHKEQQENARLLVSSHPSRRRMSLFLGGSFDDDEEEDDKEFRVTSLELFSDLIVVVAIHIVSEGGLDEPDEWWNNLPWYGIHVFQLWLVWHVAMLGFHVSHLFHDEKNACHDLVVVLFMILTLLLAGAQASKRYAAALIYFLILRVFEVGVLWLQVQRTPPDDFDPVRVAVLKSIPKTMIPWVVFGEIVPLSLSLVLSPSGGEIPYLPLVFLSCFLIITQRTFGAYKGDQMQRESRRNLIQDQPNDNLTKVLFEPSLLKERYELVNIIFIGEIAFGDTAGMHADERTFFILAVSAVLSAFGSYLLCFRTQPPISQSFWNASGVRVITGQHFYACLFSIIPGIAIGYLHIGEGIMEAPQEGLCQLESSLLLCCSMAAFILVSGLFHCINVSPKEEHRLGENFRRSLWLFFFLVALSLALLHDKWWMCLGSIPLVIILCPLLLIACACTQILGVT